jgi:hypothetical protein
MVQITRLLLWMYSHGLTKQQLLMSISCKIDNTKTDRGYARLCNIYLIAQQNFS